MNQKKRTKTYVCNAAYGFEIILLTKYSRLKSFPGINCDLIYPSYFVVKYQCSIENPLGDLKINVRSTVWRRQLNDSIFFEI